MGYHHDDDYKLHAVKHYNKNKNYAETCRIFECKRTSLMRWVDKYNETGSVKNKSRELISYKVKNKHIDFIKETLKKNKLITLEELNKQIKKKFNDWEISVSWLNKILKDNNITRKRTKRQHFPETRYGKEINFKTEVKNFFTKIKKYNIKDIISIDETSIKPNMLREYCRNDKGKRCYYKSSDNKIFRKYTLIVAISNSKLIGYRLYEKGGINAERFLKFIDDFILSKYDNKLLLFDNARAHTADNVLNEIKNSGNNYVLGVPYTPSLNPIESYFSQIKHYLKLDSEIEFDALKQSLINAFAKVKKKNYKNYFLNSLDKEKLPSYTLKKYTNEHKYKD